MHRNLILGFTLIELIIVMAIIGILAVVAIPKFLSLTTNAQTSAVNAIAGALSSANANNYAIRRYAASLGVPIANCTDAANTLQSGLSASYTITSATVAVNTTVNCTLTGPGAVTAIFTATGIS